MGKQHAGSKLSGYGVPRVGKVTVNRKGGKKKKTGIDERRKKSGTLPNRIRVFRLF